MCTLLRWHWLVWAVCLATAPARAVSVKSTDDRFHLEFQPPGARVCVVLPADATMLEDCAGVELESLRRLYLAGPPLQMALSVVRGETSYNLLYALEKPGLGAATPATAARFAATLVNAARRAAPSGQRVQHKASWAPFVLERFGSAQVIRVDLLFEHTPLAGGAPDVLEQTTYAVLGKHAVHCLYLLSPRGHAELARRDLSQALSHLEVEPTGSRERRWNQVIGSMLGWVAAGGGLLAVLAILARVVLLVVRKRRGSVASLPVRGVAGGPSSQNPSG